MTGFPPPAFDMRAWVEKYVRGVQDTVCRDYRWTQDLEEAVAEFSQFARPGPAPALALKSALEKLRDVVENPRPVRVILSRRRWTELGGEIRNTANATDPVRLEYRNPSWMGLRVDLVEGGHPAYGEVVYSDGSRRPI